MAETAGKLFANQPMYPVDTRFADRVRGEIRRLRLENNARELDVDGYTVLTPSQVAPEGFADKLREKVLAHSEAVNGVRPDVVEGKSHAQRMSQLGRSEILTNVFFSDRIFEQALMTPSVLALVTYLLGESCVLNGFNGIIKGPGPENVALHADNGQPDPFSSYSQVCNATWLLTDYDVPNGCTVFEPGSHRKCRHAKPEESIDLSSTVPLIAPAGSVVIWHGNTWHGALARTAPGLRINLLTFFGRYYVRPPQDTFSARVTQEMVDRNPERFAILTGAKSIELRTRHATRYCAFA